MVCGVQCQKKRYKTDGLKRGIIKGANNGEYPTVQVAWLIHYIRQTNKQKHNIQTDRHRDEGEEERLMQANCHDSVVEGTVVGHKSESCCDVKSTMVSQEIHLRLLMGVVVMQSCFATVLMMADNSIHLPTPLT